jgi:hypothetical protein
MQVKEALATVEKALANELTAIGQPVVELEKKPPSDAWA